MRKHQEGYVLVYVMVAVVLLSLLGAVSCEIAVSDLKAQQSTIDRMKDEYAAEGVIEAFCAELKSTTDIKETEEKYATENGAKSAAEKKLKSVATKIANGLKQDPEDADEVPPLKGSCDISWRDIAGNQCTGTAKLTLTTEQPDSTAAVETTVELTLTLTLTPHHGEQPKDSDGNPTGDPPFLGYTYTVTVDKLEYKSFTHTTVERSGQSPSGGETNQSSEAPQSGAVQNGEVVIYVSQGESAPVLSGEGEVHLTVGERYTFSLKPAEGTESRYVTQMKGSIKANVGSSAPAVVTCESLEVTGKSAGQAKLVSEEYDCSALNITIYVTE